MVKYVEGELKIDSTVPFDTKELSAKFTTDTIASCVFSLEGRCFDEAKPEFRQFGHDIFIRRYDREMNKNTHNSNRSNNSKNI